MSKSKIRCSNKDCKKYFYRENKEINRNKKKGRKPYCCMTCFSIAEGSKNLLSTSPEKVKASQKRIKKHCGNRRDEFTPFRFYTHVIRNRKTRFDSIDLDLEFLKNKWEEQSGICPHTGWKLILPDNVNGWRGGHTMYSASLDRIDNRLGYTKGNVQFVSYMANVARNKFEEKDLIEFCKAVTNNKEII